MEVRLRVGKEKGRRKRRTENQDGRRICLGNGSICIAFNNGSFLMIASYLDGEDVDSTENINVATLTAALRPE